MSLGSPTTESLQLPKLGLCKLMSFQCVARAQSGRRFCRVVHDLRLWRLWPLLWLYAKVGMLRMRGYERGAEEHEEIGWKARCFLCRLVP